MQKLFELLIKNDFHLPFEHRTVCCTSLTRIFRGGLPGFNKCILRRQNSIKEAVTGIKKIISSKSE